MIIAAFHYIKTDVMLQNSAIDKWHANLMCREEFSEAVNVVTEGKGVQSFQVRPMNKTAINTFTHVYHLC